MVRVHLLKRMTMNPPTRIKRQRIANSIGNNFIVYLVDDTLITISEALASTNANYWKEVVQSEVDFILANGMGVNWTSLWVQTYML
jgi:hypothetical protein